MRIVAAVLLVFCAAGAFAEEAPKPAALPAYILACSVGFGFGHLYLGDARWSTFFALDAGLCACMVLNEVAAFIDDVWGASPFILIGAAVLEVLAVPAYGLARAMEALSVFRLVDERRAAGELALSPVLAPQADGFRVGLRVRR